MIFIHVFDAVAFMYILGAVTFMHVLDAVISTYIFDVATFMHILDAVVFVHIYACIYIFVLFFDIYSWL